MNQKLTRILLFVGLLILGANAAFADVYATIRGSVTDPTGAVISGAQVTATNTQTGVSKTTTSQTNGLYEFLQLPVGPYTVTVSKNGFKTYKSSEFTLTVNQILDLAAKLEVGQTNETVEVRANPVQVETTSIQQQTLINSSQIVDLPLNGRNFTQLEQLAPGVMASNDRFGTFSVNGSQTQQSSYLINGLDSNDIALNTPGFIPSADAIQEFNLISSTINPEYGRNSGGIVNAVIKNGTNQWHGGIFDFYRDTFLNARNYFTVGPQQPIFHQNQFGGTFGGPIRKDKTFFFLSYQGTYNRTATQNLVTVFSAAQRAGNFAQNMAAIGANVNVTPFTIVGDDGASHAAGTPWSPAGCVPNGLPAGCATVFHPGSATAGILGTGNFNPISLGLMNQFVPSANSGTNQFAFSPTNPSKTDQGIARIDHNFNQSNQIWGVYAINNNRAQQVLPFTGSTLPGFGTFSTAVTREITVAYTHEFSTATLNELRLGYHRLNFDTVEPQTTVNPSTFGFTNIHLQDPAAAQLPFINVTGLFALGFSTNGPQPRKDQNYQLTDNFTKIIGKHTMKFGFDARRFQVDNPFFFNIDGAYAFGGNGGFSTGSTATDFLLGIPDSFSQGSGAVINARAYEYYGYAQDQWKAKSNLTVTYGAGYQIDTPYNNNQFGGLAFNCLIPGEQSTVFPTAPKGMTFPGDPGCNKSGSDIKYGHIGPRVGFAYSPQWGGKLTNGSSNKTSIRGAFGVYFNRYEEETALQNLAAPPFGLSSGGVGDVGGSAGFADPWNDISGAGSIPNKFPFTAPAKGSAVDFTFFEPMSLNTNNKNLSTPYSMNFNLNIQREFAGNTVVSLGYVGAMGRHLYRAYEADPITLAGAQACVATKACGGSALARNFQHLIFPSHSLLGDPAFGSWGTQFTDGTSDYNSMQINITKGMTHGLQLITSYTWSRSIDNGSGFENSGFGTRGTNPFFPNLNVGDSAQDARQRLVLGYIYAVPSLKNHFNWATDKVFGGWKVSGISTFQSGFPINISTSSFRSLTCDAFTFYGCPDNPNQLATKVGTLDPRNSSFNGLKNFWFDPSQFAQVPLCTYNAGGVVTNANVCGQFGNTGRDSLHGPGILNTDLALLKDTRISEGKTLEVGIEAFNIFNHAQFNNPTSNIASGNFGRITSTSIAGRIVQLRAKFNF
ncbi:MAG TPA: carboxypeptidase regulatory-like domain-containing protein [Candidatus Angelobacter sp.]|nr:carboxypeptidase regulatory-like domain-containing protein [Candidatus Angelobacter sp.]